MPESIVCVTFTNKVSGIWDAFWEARGREGRREGDDELELKLTNLFVVVFGDQAASEMKER